jgi:hypothetical protein
MKIDRDVQKRILIALAEMYPKHADSRKLEICTDDEFFANIHYLKEHGLADFSTRGVDTNGRMAYAAVATAKGIDFLADDGGLSAILGVVTIKIHDDTLKAIVASKIDGSSLPVEEKNRLANQLKDLPGEATKHLVLKLIDAGLENWQRALPIIQSMLG